MKFDSLLLHFMSFTRWNIFAGSEEDFGCASQVDLADNDSWNEKC